MIEVEMIAANLEAVADVSDLIVRGVIGANLTRIAKDDRGKETVVLDYHVRVTDVLKAPASPLTGAVTMTVPGGVYRFDDGASVEILTPSFRKPLPGEEYVLFLLRDETQGNYRLAWGTQALFRVLSDNRVVSGASRDYPTGAGVLPISAEEFVERVKRAIAGGAER